MMIENCHWGGDAPYVLDNDSGELWCPVRRERDRARGGEGEGEGGREPKSSLLSEN